MPSYLKLITTAALMLFSTITSANTTEAKAWTGTAKAFTHYGALLGHDDNGSWVWKGIPYAAPPVGELRWRAPHDPAPWKGIRDAGAFAQRCSQFAFEDKKIGGSEDCLYLNIWRPKTRDRKLPVFVWIHGGANSIGDPSGEESSGRNFAMRHPAVYVSIQYRLGVFGWLAHPALRTGNPADDSGNFGTLDITQMLRWLHDNVAAFGGDPDDVTIAGESAGGTNVITQLLSPPAKGLFQRAVAESGQMPTHSLAEGEAAANDMLAQLLVNDGKAADKAKARTVLATMSAPQIAAYLRGKSFADLYAVVGRGIAGFGVDTLPKVFVDGQVFLGSQALSQGSYPQVPLLIGTNRDEAKLTMIGQHDLVSNPELYAAVTRHASQDWKLRGADGIARGIRSRADAPPVYVYEFLWGANAAGEAVVDPKVAYLLGACHTMEIDFFLDNDDKMTNFIPKMMIKMPIVTEANRPGRLALNEAIQSYLDAFMRTGNPNTKGSKLPEWKAWSNTEGAAKSLQLDATKVTIDIRMVNSETTAQSIKAELDALPPATAETIKNAKWF